MTLRERIESMTDDDRIEVRSKYTMHSPTGDVVSWQVSSYPAWEARELLEEEKPFRVEIP